MIPACIAPAAEAGACGHITAGLCIHTDVEMAEIQVINLKIQGKNTRIKIWKKIRVRVSQRVLEL